MVNDPISDMLIRVKNGYMAGKAEVVLPGSKLKENLAQILVKTGYLAEKSQNGRDLILKLRYDNRTPAMTEVRRVSKPSLRIYAGKNDLPKVLSGVGISVISTPRGLMTNKEAHKAGLGGEIICEIW